MKKLYIPRGETRHYESLETTDIVVDGCLKVEGSIKARHISGKGVLSAGIISARTVNVMDVEAADVIARSLTAERVCAVEVHVSGAAAVSCFLEAQYVSAGKLTVAQSQIGELCCEEVVNLPQKHRSLWGTLVAGLFRGLWASLTSSLRKREPMDADYRQVEPSGQESASVQEKTAQPEKDASNAKSPFGDLENDFEFRRLAAMYRLSRERGYYLRLVPDEAGKTATPAA